MASIGPRVVYAYCKCPDEWWDIFSQTGDNQIGNQEMLSVVLALSTIGSLIDGAVVILFCDNAGVVHGLLKGSSRCCETNQMIGRTWFEVMRRRIGLRLLRVQSKANIAYLPSRKDVVLLRTMGVEELQPCLPTWLSSLREVPNFQRF